MNPTETANAAARRELCARLLGEPSAPLDELSFALDLGLLARTELEVLRNHVALNTRPIRKAAR